MSETTEEEVRQAISSAQSRVSSGIDLADGTTVSLTRKGKVMFLNVTYPVNSDMVNESITFDEPYDMVSFNTKVGELGDNVTRAAIQRTARLEAQKAAEAALQEADSGKKASGEQ